MTHLWRAHRLAHLSLRSIRVAVSIYLVHRRRRRLNTVLVGAHLMLHLSTDLLSAQVSYTSGRRLRRLGRAGRAATRSSHLAAHLIGRPNRVAIGPGRRVHLWHLFALDLLEFGSLILEPYLNYANT